MPSKKNRNANVANVVSKSDTINYNNLSKEELVILCEEKDTKIATLQVSIKDLSSRLLAVEEKLKQIPDNANSSHHFDRIEKLERDNFRNQQYARRESIELVGLPEKITDQNELEEKVVELFKFAGVDVTPRSFHAVHRLKNRAVVIAKCTNRRDAIAILRAKKKLRESDPETRKKLGVTGKVFVNESLCPEYKRLFGICNSLYKSKKIAASYTINGSIRCIEKEGGEWKAIEHINDLNTIFGEKVISDIIADHKNKMKSNE